MGYDIHIAGNIADDPVFRAGAALATALSAHIVGDDGERYDPTTGEMIE